MSKKAVIVNTFPSLRAVGEADQILMENKHTSAASDRQTTAELAWKIYLASLGKLRCSLPSRLRSRMFVFNCIYLQNVLLIFHPLYKYLPCPKKEQQYFPEYL